MIAKPTVRSYNSVQPLRCVVGRAIAARPSEPTTRYSGALYKNDMATGRVFLVDDDESVRKAIARLLRAAGHDVEVFPSAAHFLAEHAREPALGCLILDIWMPGGTGLELQEQLDSLDTDLAIIFITGHADIPTTVRALKKGAVDFLAKPIDESALLEAVERALAKSMHDKLVRSELDSIYRRVQALTAREHEVFGLVVTGMLNKQIAYAIGTTEKTVKAHRSRVMEKMQVRSLAELVHLAGRVSLIDKSPAGE
jgi:FixJ family two-component response regulator